MRMSYRNCSNFVTTLDVYSNRHTREGGYPLG